MLIKLQGSETDLTSATSVGNASLVRVYNSGGSALLVTEKNGAATVGTVTLAGGAVEYINKVPAHTLEGGAALKVVHVGFAN
tara:strand:- start:4904 stop:5149 length:246 start_codon:yes stop_codon:yes gene_type:complete